MSNDLPTGESENLENDEWTVATGTKLKIDREFKEALERKHKCKIEFQELATRFDKLSGKKKPRKLGFSPRSYQKFMNPKGEGVSWEFFKLIVETVAVCFPFDPGTTFSDIADNSNAIPENFRDRKLVNSNKWLYAVTFLILSCLVAFLTFRCWPNTTPIKLSESRIFHIKEIGFDSVIPHLQVPVEWLPTGECKIERPKINDFIKLVGDHPAETLECEQAFRFAAPYHYESHIDFTDLLLRDEDEIYIWRKSNLPLKCLLSHGAASLNENDSKTLEISKSNLRASRTMLSENGIDTVDRFTNFLLNEIEISDRRETSIDWKELVSPHVDILAIAWIEGTFFQKTAKGYHGLACIADLIKYPDAFRFYSESVNKSKGNFSANEAIPMDYCEYINTHPSLMNEENLEVLKDAMQGLLQIYENPKSLERVAAIDIYFNTLRMCRKSAIISGLESELAMASKLFGEVLDLVKESPNEASSSIFMANSLAYIKFVDCAPEQEQAWKNTIWGVLERNAQSFERNREYYRAARIFQTLSNIGVSREQQSAYLRSALRNAELSESPALESLISVFLIRKQGLELQDAKDELSMEKLVDFEKQLLTIPALKNRFLENNDRPFDRVQLLNDIVLADTLLGRIASIFSTRSEDKKKLEQMSKSAFDRAWRAFSRIREHVKANNFPKHDFAILTAEGGNLLKARFFDPNTSAEERGDIVASMGIALQELSPEFESHYINNCWFIGIQLLGSIARTGDLSEQARMVMKAFTAEGCLQGIDQNLLNMFQDDVKAIRRALRTKN